jgi:hypothetical protein
MTLGFGMNGMEEKVLGLAKTVANEHEEITYVEVGVAEGTTLSAIARTLKDSGKKWRAVGVELPNGYSFNLGRTQEVCAQRDVPVQFVFPNCSIVHPAWEAVTVYFKDSQSFLVEHWQDQIQFALIDGCHGKPCVRQDFVAIEGFSVPGTIVMFHDFGKEQIGQAQPHCPDGVDVYGACYDLGLLTGKRKGWIFLEHIHADQSQGGWDMGVFQKGTVK